MKDSIKTKVMLHYVNQGVDRSPNILFDRMKKLPLLEKKYNFIDLNQDMRPHECGHFKLILELRKKIKKEKPDIIHISGVIEGFHCMIAATLAGCKSRIIITHGFASKIEKSKVKRTFYRWIFEPIVLILATKVQCNSMFSMNQDVVQQFAKKKATCIYNISPKINIEADADDWRKKLEIGNDEFVFVTVSRITYEKGFEELSKLIISLSNLAKIRFLIVGEGTYLETFKEYVENFIKNKKVLILGNLKNEEVLQILNESDVFLLPSFHFETFGIVFVEAAYSKIPSIAYANHAVPEIIINEETGLLVKPHDIVGLKEAAQRLYFNKKFSTKLGKMAFQRANTIFSDSIIERKIDTVYRSLLND